MKTKIKVNLKRDPIKVSHKTKDELVGFLTRGKTLLQSDKRFGTAYVNYDGFANSKSVMVFNMQKHKQRFKQVHREGDKTLSIKISDKSWIAYVYEIDIKELEKQKKIVIQGNRGFMIVSKLD